jgi:RNAse H-fold protein YqgF
LDIIKKISSASRRILGIDYGDVRTGLAVSDATGLLACGIGTVKAEGDRALIKLIKAEIDKNNVGLIILGDPINMNGTRGPRSELAHTFADKLHAATGLEVILEDERCTTMNAHAILNETDTRGKKRKAVIDTLSAQIILQNYMDRTRHTI